MNTHDAKSVGEGVGEAVSEIVTAFLVITHAIKQQPGFDVSAFENRIKQVLRDSPEKDSLTANILKASLTPKD